MGRVEPRPSGKTTGLLAADGTHEHEFWVPYYRLKEEAANVIVCGDGRGFLSSDVLRLLWHRRPLRVRQRRTGEHQR